MWQQWRYSAVCVLNNPSLMYNMSWRWSKIQAEHHSQLLGLPVGHSQPFTPIFITPLITSLTTYVVATTYMAAHSNFYPLLDRHPEVQLVCGSHSYPVIMAFWCVKYGCDQSGKLGILKVNIDILPHESDHKQVTRDNVIYLADLIVAGVWWLREDNR